MNKVTFDFIFINCNWVSTRWQWSVEVGSGTELTNKVKSTEYTDEQSDIY